MSKRLEITTSVEHQPQLGEVLGLPPTPGESGTDEGQLQTLQSGLSPEEHLCAVLEGSNTFKTQGELLDHLGRSWSWYTKLREKPQYRGVVQLTVRQIAERIVGQATSVKELFNNEIPRNVATMIEIRDNPIESGKNRLAAAIALTDRAPDVPRAKEAMPTNVILQLPVQHMQTIQRALIEDKREDIVDLIKGEDFEEKRREESIKEELDEPLNERRNSSAEPNEFLGDYESSPNCQEPSKSSLDFMIEPIEVE